jgi:hypothetical protein
VRPGVGIGSSEKEETSVDFWRKWKVVVVEESESESECCVFDTKEKGKGKFEVGGM